MSTKGNRPIHQYSEESLKSALYDVREGLISILAASKKYGIPRSTIQDRIHGRVADGPRKMGPPTVLSSAEENRLVKWCHDLAKSGFPLKIDDLLNTVQTIIKEDSRETPFLNGRPGRKWYLGFLKRHPTVALREAEGISKGRAVVTEESIRKWFDDLKTYLIEENATDILEDPSRILNGDETSFSLCPKTGKVLAPKGYHNVYSVQRGNEKETVTVLLVFSANGMTVTPMVVFPYIRPPKSIIESMPDNWFLGKSETGWMVSETFFEYVANGVHNWLNNNNIQRPVLLFIDGHKSHLTMELSQFCSENGIILYALPPNTTHIMQPADVSVFKPLKSEWKKTVREWQTDPENNNKVVSKSTFCPLLQNVLAHINLTDTIKNGFRKCGLYPFNPDNVDFSKCVKNQLESLTKTRQEPPPEHPKESDYDIAARVISLIASNLLERGIQSDIVLEEIKELKKRENDKSIATIEDITIQAGTYIINSDGLLEMASPVPPGSDNNFFQTDCMTQLLEPVTEANKDISVQSIDCPSPSTSINSFINKNCSLFKPITSSSPVPGETSTTKNSSILMSPTFEKHMYFPKSPTSTQVKPKIKTPSAISALAWREHMQAKENDKLAKADAIQKRKLERQKKKKEKVFKLKVQIKSKKQKQQCGSCDKDLDSDAEEDGLKNVGCDSCPQWFHLKCTDFKNLTYDEIIDMAFICKTCTNLKD